jgi:hypothetical protein
LSLFSGALVSRLSTRLCVPRTRREGIDNDHRDFVAPLAECRRKTRAAAYVIYRVRRNDDQGSTACIVWLSHPLCLHHDSTRTAWHLQLSSRSRAGGDLWWVGHMISRGRANVGHWSSLPRSSPTALRAVFWRSWRVIPVPKWLPEMPHLG